MNRKKIGEGGKGFFSVSEIIHQNELLPECKDDRRNAEINEKRKELSEKALLDEGVPFCLKKRTLKNFVSTMKICNDMNGFFV